MSTLTESQRDTLVADLKNVIHDAEELLKLTASDVSTEATELRARVGRRLQQARDGLSVNRGGMATRPKGSIWKRCASPLLPPQNLQSTLSPENPSNLSLAHLLDLRLFILFHPGEPDYL